MLRNKTQSNKGDSARPVVWVGTIIPTLNALVSLANLGLLVYLALTSGEQQKSLEVFRKQLASAELRYSYTDG